MKHLLVKAATAAATDEGTFTAVISTANVDREGDVVEPQAMVAALAKWASLGKLVPLAWNHSDEVIGHIDPSTAQAKNGEVLAAGYIDQEHPRGADAWRLVKSGTLSFSFGYLFDTKSGVNPNRPGGGWHIKEIDIFEISVVPIAPANNDTRVLSWKSLDEREALTKELQATKTLLAQAQAELADMKGTSVEETGKEHSSRSVDPLRKQSDELALDVAMGHVRAQGPKPKSAAPDDLRRRSRDLMLQLLSKETEG